MTGKNDIETEQDEMDESATGVDDITNIDGLSSQVLGGLPNPFRRQVLRAVGVTSSVAVGAWSAGCSLVLPERATTTPQQSPTEGSPSPTETQTSTEGTPQSLSGQLLVFAEEYSSGEETYSAGTVVTAETLTAPDAALVLPEDAQGDDNRILLHKLEPDQLASPTNIEWTDQGFVGYSAICTHQGCAVGWTEDSHDVGNPHDHCPCHPGEFDPYKGAEVVGGPPPRPLPQIGVTVNDNGELELTSEFEGDAEA